jgi:demethoxyubiquinone hydroxylase (CLK1/Coq7/Cat5 family)
MFEFAPVTGRIQRSGEARCIYTGEAISIKHGTDKIYTDYYKTHEIEHRC